ncbi:Protein RRP6-like 2, partial [Mucuna pruriens]
MDLGRGKFSRTSSRQMNQPSVEATWQVVLVIEEQFPQFNLKDKVQQLGGDIVRNQELLKLKPMCDLGVSQYTPSCPALLGLVHDNMGLYEWRDVLARTDDESPGYVLPNKIILEIAKQMPVIISNLRRIVGKSKLPYVERNLDVIVNIVRHSMQNPAAFEEAALRLKEEHAASLSNVVPVKDGTEVPQTLNLKVGGAATGSIGSENDTCIDISENCLFSSDLEEESFQHQDKDGQGNVKSGCLTSDFPMVSPTTPEKNRDDANVIALTTVKDNRANVQVLKMPTGAFDATLLGNSASEWKPGPNKKAKVEIKLEQIKSPISLPSQLFLGNSEKSKLVVETVSVASETSDVGIVMVVSDSDSEDMIQTKLESSNNHPGENSLVPRKRR